MVAPSEPRLEQKTLFTAQRLQTALWIGLGLLGLALLYLLRPILAPFLIAGILAYVCSPLVDRLQAWRLPRTLAVLLVILLLIGLLTGLVLIMVPLLSEEAGNLAERLPQAVTLAHEKLIPWLQSKFGWRVRLDPAAIKALLADNIDNVQPIAQRVLQSLTIGGRAIFGVVANLLLTPVVMFYLLLDWQSRKQHIAKAIPLDWHAQAARIARDIDAVLSQFLRGQMSVMMILAIYYSIGLSLVGLPSSVAIGIVTGFLIFVPYLGFATGFSLALMVALLQFEGWGPIVEVLIVFGIGQLLESFVLTPFLVGERIGLHPLAVIFALMAFGQLFGFVGILLALPASAALLVGLRELRNVYFASSFYRGNTGDAA